MMSLSQSHKARLLACSCATILGAGGFSAQACMHGTPEEREAMRTQRLLTDLPLNELFNQSTSIATRSPKAVGDTAAAVFVISEEDIRRSGATMLAELLRMVPGAVATQGSSFGLGIALRGFSQTQDKLQVLIDGRSIYSPQKSQIYWHDQGLLLEDIERIEVVRGPGGTLWGSNAVNGVINIITKSAERTQGAMLVTAAGNELRASTGLRYGSSLSDDTCYRVYARGMSQDNTPLAGGSGEANDDWSLYQAGFRIDHDAKTANVFNFQGNIYRGTFGEGWEDPDTDDSGANLLARWQHNYTDSNWQLQGYYDRVKRNLFQSQEFVADSFDVDFQHHLLAVEGHNIIWGAGYHYTLLRSEIRDRAQAVVVAFDPASRHDNLFSLFAQDEITVRENDLFLTLGTKLEHNDYSGWEWQPNVRLLWHANDRYRLWGAVSRAVRRPNLNDHNIDYSNRIEAQKTVLRGRGNPDFEAETVLAYELGLRGEISAGLSWDLAAYFNRYDKLYMLGYNAPYQEDGFTVVPLYLANGMDGEAFGAELSVLWNTRWLRDKRWKIELAYTWQNLELHSKPGYQAVLASSAEGQEGSDPENVVSLRSSWDLVPGLDFDLWLRFVDERPNFGQDSYTTLDLRLGWQPVKNLEIALVGKHLLDDRHTEAGNAATGVTTPRSGYTAIERSWYVKLDWRF